MYTPQELNRIKWQCRRGMRELDVIIEPFFEEDFSSLDEDLKRIFVRILNESDLMLFRWLLRGETPKDYDYIRLIDVMLERHAARVAANS